MWFQTFLFAKYKVYSIPRIVHFSDLFRNSFWKGKRNILLTNLSVHQNKIFLRQHTGFLDKRKKTPPYVYKIRKHLFQLYQLIFVWNTFSWNDPLENNVYKHPWTNSTCLTQAYHQCTSQQVLSTSPWPVTAFTKALCSLAI